MCRCGTIGTRKREGAPSQALFVFLFMAFPPLSCVPLNFIV